MVHATGLSYSSRPDAGLPFGGLFLFAHAGVDFFFVLSGFIIYRVHRGDIGSPHRLSRYAWRRFVRIYPTYWIILAGFGLLLLYSPKRTRRSPAWVTPSPAPSCCLAFSALSFLTPGPSSRVDLLRVVRPADTEPASRAYPTGNLGRVDCLERHGDHVGRRTVLRRVAGLSTVQKLKSRVFLRHGRCTAAWPQSGVVSAPAPADWSCDLPRRRPARIVWPACPDRMAAAPSRLRVRRRPRSLRPCWSRGSGDASITSVLVAVGTCSYSIYLTQSTVLLVVEQGLRVINPHITLQPELSFIVAVSLAVMPGIAISYVIEQPLLRLLRRGVPLRVAAWPASFTGPRKARADRATARFLVRSYPPEFPKSRGWPPISVKS